MYALNAKIPSTTVLAVESFICAYMVAKGNDYDGFLDYNNKATLDDCIKNDNVVAHVQAI